MRSHFLYPLARRSGRAAFGLLTVATSILAQGTLTDYQRSQALQAKARGLVVNTPGTMTWIGDSDHLWYPRSVKGGTEFMLVDAGAVTKELAFDHNKLAAGISSATGNNYTGLNLPFAPDPNARPATRRPVDGSIPTSSPLTFVDGVDLPPVAQLRRSDDQKVVMDLDKGDDSALRSAGFKYPEVFAAKRRDAQTDIWGVIIRPLNFDPSKKYPVIENIYAGPQGSFVPKTYSAVSADQALAELGFIVVHIDGMGTGNRSKAFHDVIFKNLGDGGFPDRILWHKAAAAKYPYYDISRVGIFGTSAGGQSSLGGVLFHPDFYKVVVTNSGCHDNWMDKLWWNEQWMSWPLGPQYSASSNIDNAYRLQGKALIIVGEMDSNVDPASSMQVVNALVKAHKHFDMLYIPGQNHGVGILNSEHYRDDYFVHNLLGVEPPDWNKVSLPKQEEQTPTASN